MLSALDPASGEQRWQFQAADASKSPTVADGTVYFGDASGNVYALDAGSGEQQWRYELLGNISTPPVVADGSVVLAGDDSEDWASGTDTIYGRDATSGEAVWRVFRNSHVYSSPAVADGTVHVGISRGEVYAFDVQNGEALWVFETSGRIRSAPAVADGTVYVGDRVESDGRGHVYAIDPDTLAEKWRFRADDYVDASPAVADGTVYVGSADANVYALDSASGEERWRFQAEAGVNTAPAVVANTVYVGDVGGTVYGIDASSGEERWRVETDGAVSSTAVADGTVYVGSDGVYAFAAGASTATPTSTPAPTTRSPDAAGSGGDDGRTGGTGDDGDSNAMLPLAGGLAALGAGGGLWYLRRNGDDDDGRPTVAVTREDDSGTRPGDRDPGGTPSPATARDPDDSHPATATPDAEGGLAGGRAGGGGPPASIPRAPDVAVDHGALTDEEPIGGGGNADVVRAALPTSEGDVPLAIKRPRMSGTLHADAVDRLLQEAETWDRLDDHDHVVSVVDYGAEPLPWIAMEYMDAGDLSDRAGDLPLEQALWTALGITASIRHAHRRGVAHLDLKPANVLFRGVDGAWDVPKVADWGLSKHLLEHSKSVEGLSPQYAAPEQFDTDRGPADDLTDVYQLGAVLYELFTGRPPFEGDPTSVMHQVLQERPTPPSEVADLPPALDDVLLTALEKERADRHDAVVYVRDAIRELSESR
jgi:outer membrane protein assembly factor BamB